MGEATVASSDGRGDGPDGGAERPRILLTGAAGNVGRRLRGELAGRYRLRLTDIVGPVDVGRDEEYMRADLRDLDAMERVTRGVTGVIHLGGIPGEAPWDVIAPVNIDGTHNVLEAARRVGAERVVFASSNHVVGFYPRAETIGTEVLPRPDTRYGVSKAAGEALGALYAHKHGLRVMCLRLGHVIDEPKDERDLAIWLSPRDLAQLVVIGLEHPDIGYEVLYGMSDNARSWWSDPTATRLGYRPVDRAEEHAERVGAASQHDPPSTADVMQGGRFTVFDGRPRQLPAVRRRWLRRLRSAR